MKIQAEIPIIEIDGKETGVSRPNMTVSSHWNENGTLGLVVINVDGTKSVTVSAAELQMACRRCTGIK